jgi:hypothetical protein
MKVICSKCKGEGKVPDIAERVFTLGISWVFDKLSPNRIGWERCPRCKGKGFLQF